MNQVEWEDMRETQIKRMDVGYKRTQGLFIFSK